MIRAASRIAKEACKRASGAAGMGLAAGRAPLSTLTVAATGAGEASKTALAAAVALAATSTVAFASSARQERSFIMVKPDGVNRGLVGEIVSRFECKGYKLVGIKVVVPSPELASMHYAEHDGRPFFPKLVNFLSSGPVVAMVFEGSGVVAYGRTMIGVTNPLASAPGTIRGDYGIDVGRNIIHGSDSVESAQREISLWMKAEECAEYERKNDYWVYE